MNIDNLVSMANQIGDFFDAAPDRAEALAGLTQHIRRFWAPRMRIQLNDYWKGGGPALSPIVRDALAAHSILATPVPVRTSDPVKAAEQHAFDGDTES